MLPFGLGVPEVIVILLIALLVFGPSKLPELGKNLGKALKNFKNGLKSASEELNNELSQKE